MEARKGQAADRAAEGARHDAGPVLRCLHLSDFHVGSADGYEQMVVLKALLRKTQELRESGRAPQVMFASGDIAKSGQASEYAVATAFLDDLLQAAGLDRRSLFVVPGNHDVDRSRGRGLLRTLDTEDQSVEFFGPDHPRYHAGKLEHFQQWYDDYFRKLRQWDPRTTCQPPGYLEAGGLRLCVLQINSALFSIDDNDHRKLWVGRRCLDASTELIDRPNIDLCVALLHHPIDWLHDVERPSIRARLSDVADVILHGHMHESEFSAILDPGGATCLMAGACYQTRRYPNRVLLVDIGLVDGMLAVTPLRYEDQPREVWTVDPSLFPNDSGYRRCFSVSWKYARPQSASRGRVVDLPKRQFDYGGAVPPEYFIDREIELAEVEPCLRDGQSLLLVGNRRAGKTSFCFKLMHQLMAGENNDLLPVRVNLETIENLTPVTFLEHTLIAMAGDVARFIFGCRFSDVAARRASEAMQHWIRREPLLGEFIRFYRALQARTHLGSQGGSPKLAPREFLGLAQDLAEIVEAKGWRRCVVIYDEANHLPKEFSVDLLIANQDELGAARINCLYVASPEMAESFSRLSQSFERAVELGPFPDIAYLTRLLARYYFGDISRTDELPMSPESIHLIWQYSHGLPYRIQVLSGESVRRARRDGAAQVRVSHVTEAYATIKARKPSVFADQTENERRE